MADILVTLPSAGSVSTSQLNELVAAGLTGVRVIIKGRSADEIAGDVETLLDYVGAGVLPGPVWVDLPGIRPRVAHVDADRGFLDAGAEVTVSDEFTNGQVRLQNGASILSHARAGSEISIADGLIRLEVLSIETGNLARCRVLTGGALKLARSASLVGDDLAVDYFGTTDLDYQVARAVGDRPDLRYVISWVSKAAHVETVSNKLYPTPVIPKLESMIPDHELAPITAAAAEVLVGRADLSSSVDTGAMKPTVDRYVTAAKKQGSRPYVGSLLVDSLEKLEQPTASDIQDLEHLMGAGVNGFLISGNGDSSTRLRKVRSIRSVAEAQGV